MRQQQLNITELYNNEKCDSTMKNDNKEMLSIDILFLSSNYFGNPAFNIIIKYNR